MARISSVHNKFEFYDYMRRAYIEIIRQLLTTTSVTDGALTTTLQSETIIISRDAMFLSHAIIINN